MNINRRKTLLIRLIFIPVANLKNDKQACEIYIFFNLTRSLPRWIGKKHPPPNRAFFTQYNTADFIYSCDYEMKNYRCHICVTSSSRNRIGMSH